MGENQNPPFQLSPNTSLLVSRYFNPASETLKLTNQKRILGVMAAANFYCREMLNLLKKCVLRGLPMVSLKML
jgi:hypothetical protein